MLGANTLAETTLKSLRAKQKAEVDKLKKRTKYDETRSLLERYDQEARRAPIAVSCGLDLLQSLGHL